MIFISYDLEKELMNIELELINDIKTNLRKRLGKNLTYGVEESITHFQASAIAEIDSYRKDVLKTINSLYDPLYNNIEDVIKTAYVAGAKSEEYKILSAIHKGFVSSKTGVELNQGFFTINRNKLNSLQRESINLLNNCKISILRTTDDIYREIVYKSSIYSNLGFSTWECVDKSMEECLRSGITGITYKNGNRVNISSYLEMAVRTSSVRATQYGEGSMRENWGINTVLISQYGSCSKLCMPWQGRIYEDDVYTNLPYRGKYPRLSDAIHGGLFHPNCRHTSSTYFPEINEKPKKQSKKQQQETTEHSELEKKQRYYERKIRENKKLEAAMISPTMKKKYHDRVLKYQKIQREFIQDTNKNHGKEILRREYSKEKLR